MENLENLKSKLVQIIKECSDRNMLLKVWEDLNSENISIVSEPQSIYESEAPMSEEEVEEYFKEEVVELPQSILDLLKVSEKQIENGEYYTEEEMEKMDEEWLN